MKIFLPLLTALAVCSIPVAAAEQKKPNVLLIVCDDLNDYVESLGGCTPSNPGRCAVTERRG